MHLKYATEKKYGCLSPVNQKYLKIGVGCGKCPKCIQKKRGEWFLRLGHEIQTSTSAYFVTLTYQDKCLPRNNGKPTLHRSDLNKFLKNIRRKQDNLLKQNNVQTEQKIRFYGCGEYGDNFERPHYHLLLFNTLPDIITDINNIWNYGNAQCGAITPARMMYTTKYITKIGKHPAGTSPPFVRMSTGKQRPSGMGGQWLKKNANYLRKNKILLVPNVNGRRQFIPRYYRNYLWPDEEERKEIIYEHMKDYRFQLMEQNDKLQKHQDLDDYLWTIKEDTIRRFKKSLTKTQL